MGSRLFAGFAALAAVPAAALGATQAFTDEASFRAVLGQAPVSAGFDRYPDGSPVPSNVQVPGDAWASLGIRFSSPLGLYTATSDFASNTPPNSLSTGSGPFGIPTVPTPPGVSAEDDDLTVDFSPGARAAGFWILDSNFVRAGEEIRFLAADGSRVATLAMPRPAGFRGVVSDVPIVRIQILENVDGDDVLYDTFLFVPAAAPNHLPVAVASASPASAFRGEAVSFSAAGSADPEGPIASYAWDFGDGAPPFDATASGGSASHAYASLGTFTAVLTVTDGDGASATASAAVTVVNRSPVASASATPETTFRGDPVSFSAAGSFDPDGPLSTYAWDFGDGAPPFDATASGGSASHAYASLGTFTAVLTVTDGDGASATASAAVDIVNRPPEAFARWILLREHKKLPWALFRADHGGFDPDGRIVFSAGWVAIDGLDSMRARLVVDDGVDVRFDERHNLIVRAPDPAGLLSEIRSLGGFPLRPGQTCRLQRWDRRAFRFHVRDDGVLDVRAPAIVMMARVVDDDGAEASAFDEAQAPWQPWKRDPPKEPSPPEKPQKGAGKK